MNATLDVAVGDITRLRVEAIVNAANEQLARGGGVCGAIHRAAGPALEAACRAVAPCPTGGARITPGFDLPAQWVIHAVGPVWQGGQRGEDALLAGAYRASLELAHERRIASIAFPAISTGIFGFPLECATRIAVQTVREESKRESSLRQVIFACFDERTAGVYRAALEE
jgi:O-acetyl-ADP-ribose deacetylase (regulator of RNase III)